MKQITQEEMMNMIQSAHLNFFIGAGCSAKYLGTLGDIERQMNDAKTKIEAQKKYSRIMKKSKNVLNELLDIASNEEDELKDNKNDYKNFLQLWKNILHDRSLQIVNKQANIFTTNFDMFIEESCERCGIPYNDGFAGQIKPTFNVSNFNVIQKYKSLQFDNISDVPLFNIIKLHGSISWKIQNDMIVYSNDYNEHILDGLLAERISESDFEKKYKNLAVVNPNAEKHLETVLNINYAAMLRKFTLELEKENSILILIGTSLNDEHIKKLLEGVTQSNPTLVVIYFLFLGNKKVNKEPKIKQPDCCIIPNYLKDLGKNSNFYIMPDHSFQKAYCYFKDIFCKPKDEANEDNSKCQKN